MKGKKILSLMLAVMLVLGALPAGLSFTAAADGGTDGDIEWQVYGRTLTISGGSMPDYSGGDTPWHEYRDNITTVIIVNGVQNIGDCAFEDMESLGDVTIPGSVKSIGRKAFEFNSLKSVTIPDGVESIDYGAFYLCRALESVTIPRSMNIIDAKAFDCCESLSVVNYTGGGADWNKISIADSAFEDTPANRIVRYYYGVQGTINAIDDIGANDGTNAYKVRVAIAFAAYNRLSNAEKDQVTNLDLLMGAVNSLPVSSFGTCGVNTAYVLGQDAYVLIGGVGATGDDPKATTCFYDDSLMSLLIEEGVTSVGEGMFDSCLCLELATLPKSLKAIGSRAFAGCEELTDIYYAGGPADWEKIAIAADAFDDLSALTIHYYYGVAGTINAINDIGTVEHTDVCKARIDAARKAYDSLSDYETTQVTNYQTLTDAEAEYARLEAAALPKAIRLGAGALDADNNTENAATVYYGGYAWRVIGYDGAGTASESGTVTLLAADIEKTTIFSNINNHYSSSELRIEVNKIAGAFTEPEEKAVPFRLLVSVIDPSDPDGIAGVSVRARLWPLSLGEAVDTNDALRSYYRQWWLRSPGDTDNVVGYVMNNGTVAIVGTFRDLYAVRPAFWLDLNKVLFASAAENGKVGDGLTAVGGYTGTDWKLTVLDESRGGFTAKCTNIDNGVYTITYSGATTGTNEKISAVIVDEDGIITYYGVLCDAAAGRNTLTLDVNGKLQSGDTLYVFNEQVNGDKKTDYAGALVDVTEKTLTSYDLWVGGVQFDENNLEINADDIPGVSGSATYDPEKNELTLDGFQYTGEGYRYLVDPGTQNEHLNTAGIYYDGTDDLTVRLMQENAVTVTGDATYSDAFCSENLRTAVTFTGTGSLTARGADNAQEVSSGITVSGSLCVGKQATVTGVGGDSCVSSYGVLAYVPNTKLEVYGKLTGNGGSASNRSCGVFGAEITVGTDAVLTAAGSAAGNSSEGIVAASVTVRSGKVEAASGKGERYSLAFKAKTGDNIPFELSDELTMRAGESKDENEIVTGDGWKNQKYVLIEVFRYKAGDTLQYGTYPQSEVKDAATVAALNAKLRSNGWISYGYYIGTGGYNGEMAPDDFMRYQDVVLDGVKYRAVTFDSYRPNDTADTSSAGNSTQDENGYDPGNTYWFQFEPVTWKVLDPESGLVLCTGAIDAQAYHNYVVYSNQEYWGNADKTKRANDYAHSDIRAWLNEDFINTAFSTAQQENIKVSELNDASTHYDYVYESSTDKIFLLSTDEAANGAYGFDPNADSMDPARQLSPSDYAKCQGIYESAAKYSFWLLRDYCGNDTVRLVSTVGKVGITVTVPSATDGVVPAMRMQELQDDPTGAPLKVTPEVDVTIDNVTYNSKAIAVINVSNNANGTVSVTVKGSGTDTYTYGGTVMNGVASVDLTNLPPDTYTATVDYSGDEASLAPASGTATFTVARATPDMSVTTPTVTYGEDAVITATLPADATGSVIFSLVGSKNTYSFTDTSITDGVAQVSQKLNADTYTVTATYSGDGKYDGAEKTITFTVNQATPEITMTAEPKNEAKTAYEITVTKPADSTQGVTIYAYYSGLPAFVLGIGNDKFENGSYTFRFPDAFEDYLSDNVSGEFELSAVYDGRNDQNYQDNIVKLAITLGCDHVWKEPTWDWSQDVNNPTYTAECSKCTDGKITGQVTSTPGTRVEATVEKNAYTPYTASVELSGQTFTDTFELEEPGTMLAARKAAFEQYKADQKKAAEDKALDGDSDDATNLIDAAKKAVDDVTYNESKPLDENKQAVDAAANLPQLEEKLADQRAADAVERQINNIGDVAYTDEIKAKIDEARKAYDDLTDAQKALVDNKDTLEKAEADYQLLENKDAFEKYKDELKQAAEEMRKDDDSQESKKMIDDTIDAIEALEYDESKSLDDNKKAVEGTAKLDELTEQLEEHRAVYYAVFKADGIEVASLPYTIDTKSIDEPAVPVKDNYTGAWPKYELKEGGVEINAVYTKNDALVITDNAKEQGADRVLTFMETVTFTTDTSALPEGATLCWYVNGEAVSADKSCTVESPKDDYTVQVRAFAKDGTLYTESEVLTVKVDHSFRAKLVYFFNLAFGPVTDALKKVVPSFFSFLVALIKAIATALIAAVKSVI